MASRSVSRPTVLPDRLVAELSDIVGVDSVLTKPGELVTFESDALTLYRARPAAVVFVRKTDELVRAVRALHAARVPFVPRGAGTGLSGGALAEGKVVLELSRMNRILWIDDENRRARVQTGVVNIQLQNAVARHGLMYAPDPSSQTVSTLGGNIAENSGGPHCVKYGVTTNHVLGLGFVTSNGELMELPGSVGPGYDLTGLIVGSEGTLGIVSEIEVRLSPRPPAVATLLAHFDAIEAAARAVSAIIAAGIVPAALEMIDRETLRTVEESIFAAGFPTDVAASLIVELDGPQAGLLEQAAQVRDLLVQHGAREVARAESEEDRARFWKARKSAFGAMGRLAPELLVQDATVPRSRLPDVLEKIKAIGAKHDLTVTNVFHAGDGNLHPNIPFDRRDEAVLERVRAASREIMAVCVEAGGTITGEHGVGIDKRHYMPLIYSTDDLHAMRWVKEAFDPAGLCNPGKVLPDDVGDEDEAADPTRGGSRGKPPSADAIAGTIELALGSDCLVDDPETFRIDGTPAEVAAAPASLAELAELMKLAAGDRWTVLPVGHGTWLASGRPFRRQPLVVSTRRLRAPVEHQPDDLLATVAAGTSIGELNETLQRNGQWWPVDPLGAGTIGATVATASAGPLATAYGTPRDVVLGLTVVAADGRVVRAGGRVVKNVAGYDLVKLFTGSFGTLGIIASAHLRLYARQPADITKAFVSDRADALIALSSALARSENLVPAAMEILAPRSASALGHHARWLLVARWLGHGAAVESATAAAAKAAIQLSCRADSVQVAWEDLGSLEERLATVLTVRVDVPPRSLEVAVHAARPFVGFKQPGLMASPPLGRVWIFVPAELYDAATIDPRHWALRVQELRRAVARVGGWTRIEQGPPELRAVVNPWGDVGAAARLHDALKSRFDPGSVLKPGFLAWQ